MTGGHERQDPLGEAVETVPALVVGGGVGGLNAARTLTELGVPALLLEARARCGGLVFGAKLGDSSRPPGVNTRNWRFFISSTAIWASLRIRPVFP